MKAAPNRSPRNLLRGTHGWQSGLGHLTAAPGGPAIVTGDGKSRIDLTSCISAFGTGVSSARYVSDLYWRKPELKDKDQTVINA
jgi:hypothetical protein